MNKSLIKLYVKMQNLMKQEDGQDLVEYGLVLALVAVVVAAALPALATAITDVFDKIKLALNQ